jgi:murein DD-endopeptidase MepM/ murein hydrolase activator NlpD
LLVIAGSGTVAAETSNATKPPPEPRIQRPGDVAGYRLPFEPGLDVYIHQGWNSVYSHNGRSEFAYDFGLHVGTPVLAAATGVVSYVHSGEKACGGATLRNHANYVTIDHPDGSSTQYGHLSTVEVEVGDVVQVGQRIALSGMTGYTGCRPHLHFARQLQGSGVTQSIPVYFEEYPNSQLLEGETIRTTAACTAKPGKAAKAGAKSDAGTPSGWFCATYRGGTDVKAPVLFSRSEQHIDNDWSTAGPGGYWLDDPTEGFSATWTGRFRIDQKGVYSLDVLASGRVRVRIDGVLLVNAWTDTATAGDLSVAWRATRGMHLVEVQHVDVDGHGTLYVSWRPNSSTGPGFDGRRPRWRPETATSLVVRASNQ